MCELTLQMILLCNNCSLSLNVFNIGLQCNLQFCNDGGIFNDFFIANLLLSVMVKEF